MARIRTIKPEFWGHPKTARLSRDARLLFLGLLNESDDEGRQLGSPKRIAGSVFPHDEDVTAKRVTGWLTELETVGMIERYEVDAIAYLSVIGFANHQKVAHPSPSRLPPPARANESRKDRETLVPDLGPRNKDLGIPPGGAAAPPTDVQSDTTALLVAGYVTDYRLTHGGNDPSSGWRAQAGKAVKALLADGADPDELVACLSAVAKESKSPSVLAHVLADYQAREAV